MVSEPSVIIKGESGAPAGAGERVFLFDYLNAWIGTLFP
jgi:hypothetical protein